MGKVSNVQATQIYPDSLTSVYKYGGLSSNNFKAKKKHQHFCSIDQNIQIAFRGSFVRLFAMVFCNEIILSTK